MVVQKYDLKKEVVGSERSLKKVYILGSHRFKVIRGQLIHSTAFKEKCVLFVACVSVCVF